MNKYTYLIMLAAYGAILDYHPRGFDDEGPGVSGVAWRHAELPHRRRGTHLMAMPALVPRYTAREIRAFPDDRVRYEVIRGELFVTPAPGLQHQRAVLEIARLLQDYIERNGLGEVLMAPFEVELTEDSAVQPDVLVILADRASRLTSQRLMGPPSLAVEVISYTSKRTDRLQKRRLYQEEGVAEYWIVDPEERRVERWGPADETPQVLTDRLVWQPAAEAPELVIDLVALFSKVWR